METPYKFSHQELQLTQKLLDIFDKFQKTRLPEIYWSDEIPPILNKPVVAEEELRSFIAELLSYKKLTIDNLLGCYLKKKMLNHLKKV